VDIFSATSVNGPKTAQRKKSPNSRKFAQSGQPALDFLFPISLFSVLQSIHSPSLEAKIAGREKKCFQK
jgi:hypothetical protein